MYYDGPLNDVHAHVYPDTTARAPFMDGYRLPLEAESGLVSDCQRYMKEAGVEKTNMLMMYAASYRYHDLTRSFTYIRDAELVAIEEIRRQVVDEMVRYNEFGVDQVAQDASFSCFVGLDPALMDPQTMMQELEDKVRRGATGVKLVPLDYAVTLDDPRHDPIWDYCQAYGLPITHAPGWPSYFKATGWQNQFGHPLELAAVYRRFPRLRTCASHLANAPYLAEIGRRFGGVHADLSAILLKVANGVIDADALVNDIRSIGADRVLFGTNFGTMPTANAVKQAETFRTLPLTDDEFQRIGFDNYAVLMGR